MSKKDSGTQKTPKGHTIPVPEKRDVMRDLKKVAKHPYCRARV